MSLKIERSHARAEIAHFLTRCIIRAWKAFSLRPRASQVLMIHWVGKHAISAWAWVLAFIPWPVRNIKVAMWKHAFPHTPFLHELCLGHGIKWNIHDCETCEQRPLNRLTSNKDQSRKTLFYLALLNTGIALRKDHTHVVCLKIIFLMHQEQSLFAYVSVYVVDYMLACPVALLAPGLNLKVALVLFQSAVMLIFVSRKETSAYCVMHPFPNICLAAPAWPHIGSWPENYADRFHC